MTAARTRQTKTASVVKPEVNTPETNKFVGSGLINLPYLKKCLDMPSPMGYSDYMYTVYGLPFTCSAGELSQPGNKAFFARMLVKYKVQGSRKMALVNCDNELYKNTLKLFGFKEVFSYVGNHSSVVTTYMCDLNGINLKCEQEYMPTILE